MIYLIETVYYVKETGKVLDLLKIDYTEDSNKQSRISQYKLHNPGHILLYEIPGGTEDHEKRIQYRFKDLQYSEYGREWFYYDEEIVEFFNNIDSLEKLEDELPKDASSKLYSKYRKRVKKIVEFIYPIDLENITSYSEVRQLIQDYSDDLVKKLGDRIDNEENVLNYLRKDLGDDLVEEFLKKEDDVLNLRYPEEVVNFVKRYNTIPSFYEKLKELCEYGLGDEGLDIVLNKILSKNSEIRYYYNSLGPDNLKRLGYNTTKIKKELGEIVFDPEVLKSNIYSEFRENDKIPLSDIKEKLKEIYIRVGYTKTPKANDLDKYFELRLVYITVIDAPSSKKKQVKGYELLKIRN